MNQNLFIFSHVTTSSVQKLFSSLDNNKATGLNGISVHTLGAGSPILMYYLTYLFNFSLSTGYVPACWKKRNCSAMDSEILGFNLIYLIVFDVQFLMIHFQQTLTRNQLVYQIFSAFFIFRNGPEQQSEELGSWFHKNKLSVNSSKTEVIFFGKSNKVEQCKNETAISKRNIYIKTKYYNLRKK